jgi:hypothetical protein
LPLVNMTLQAMGLNGEAVFTVVVDGAVYVSQSDRGELVCRRQHRCVCERNAARRRHNCGHQFAALLDPYRKSGCD